MSTPLAISATVHTDEAGTEAQQEKLQLAFKHLYIINRNFQNIISNLI